MKKLLIFLLLFLFMAIYTQANPIMPESLFSEVYFENNDWYLVIDHEIL